MKGSPTRNIGLLAIMIGIGTLIGVVAYMLSASTFNRTPLLVISAFLITIGALLNMILVWIFNLIFREQAPGFSMLGVIAGLIGSIIVFLGSGLDLLRATLTYSFDSFPLSQTRSIMVFGYAFIGLWLMLLNYYALLHDMWSRRLIWLGMVTGTIMAMGWMSAPGIFDPYLGLYHVPSFEIGKLLGTVGWMFFYPIWSIWLGNIVLSNRSEITQHNNFFSNTR